MAHFAELDETNTVLRVVVINNQELIDDGVESEEKGILYCQSLFGPETKWKQTSYNGSFRKNFAGVGFLYAELLDAFLEPKPFFNWVLNNTTYKWEAPVPYPSDGMRYAWDGYINNWRCLGEELNTPEQT